jgi:hypothetical protein
MFNGRCPLGHPTGHLSSASGHITIGRAQVGSAEYFGSASRWTGPGNQEFRENLARAFREKTRVRLVISSTKETEHVESGADASKVKKDFHVLEDLVGKVVEYDGNNYVIRFTSAGGGGK